MCTCVSGQDVYLCEWAGCVVGGMCTSVSGWDVYLCEWVGCVPV